MPVPSPRRRSRHFSTSQGERSASFRSKNSGNFVRILITGALPVEVRDERLRGFLVRVQPSGWKSYYVEYGRGKRLALGRADVLSASIAREKAREILAQAVQGHDPQPSGSKPRRTRCVPS
jgi:hypothetical protein